ncbi:MAG: hypothetical protein ABI873_11195 [Marmoricola sp.]
MSRSNVVANRRVYTVNSLEPRAPGAVFQAVMIARLVDGVTGDPVTGQRADTKVPGLSSRSARDGYVGLVGTPSRVLPALSGTAYDVEVAFEADGFATRLETVHFPVQPTFPGTFEARDLGVLELHLKPTSIEATTYELDAMGHHVVLPGSSVRVVGHWAAVAGLGSAAALGPMLALRPGLSASRPSGTTFDLPAVTPAVEPVRRLASAAGSGETRIALDNRGALVPGDLVGIGLGSPERAEIIEVSAVHAAADATSPAEVELRFAVQYPHPDGARVQRIPLPAAAPTVCLATSKGIAGDQTMLVSTLAGLAPGQVARISGGPAAAEYRVVELYDVATDVDGFGRLPPLTGLAAVQVAAASGPMHATARVNLTPATPTRKLDLTLG